MLSFHHYSIPFREPFKTSAQKFTHREGIILSYEEGDLKAYGEVAPLPGFSPEQLRDVITVLTHNRKYLENGIQNRDADQIIHVIKSVHKFPSLSFGLDTLLTDLKAKTRQKSFSEQLFNKQLTNVTSNAVVGTGKEEETLKKIDGITSAGYSTVKLKVGIDFQSEKRVLSLIRKYYPGLKIRIDANQSWNTQEAIDNLNDLAFLEIEYCEQPVSFDDFDALKKVKENSPVRIAADESAGNLSSVKELIKNQYCDLIIIKPSILGSFDDLFVTKELADSHNIEVVFTTLLESKVGRTATAVLAAGLGSDIHAHGLATGSLLNEEEPDNISDGKFTISKKAGLGISIDLTPFKKISV